METIATRDLLGTTKEGTRLRIHVRIGRPYAETKSEWACPVEVEGLAGKLPDIRGIDALQALWLAILIVRELLVGFVQDGGQLYWPDEPDHPLTIDDLLR